MTNDESHKALESLLGSASCHEFWVGFNNLEGHGWRWPTGCPAHREYGECSGRACREGHGKNHCVAHNNNVAYCSETSQCCACSIPKERPSWPTATGTGWTGTGTDTARPTSTASAPEGKIVHKELYGNDLKDMKWEWCHNYIKEKLGGEILS